MDHGEGQDGDNKDVEGTSGTVASPLAGWTTPPLRGSIVHGNQAWTTRVDKVHRNIQAEEWEIPGTPGGMTGSMGLCACSHHGGTMALS